MNRNPSKQQKSEVIRARCDGDLKNLVVTAAMRLGLEEADVLRLAAREYAARVVYKPTTLPVG